MTNLFIKCTIVLCSCLFMSLSAQGATPVTVSAVTGPVFELRTYTTYAGRLPALNKRFKEHTIKLFEKHGMTNIGYWVPTDPEKSKNTLIYIISHKSREAAKQNWKAFVEDPEWQKVHKESHKDGKIVENVDSVFMSATPYSPIK